MSRMGTKTYSRKTECRTATTNPFDQLLAERGNKPSTAKVSVSAVHRWGMTSYTSIRKTHLNGEKEPLPEKPVVEPVKRIKLEPKVIPVSQPPLDDPFSFESNADTVESVCFIKDSKECRDGKPARPKPNKFFKSGAKSRAAAEPESLPKKNDFDALRLSVTRNWNSLRQTDTYSVMPTHKKLSYLPVIERTPVTFQSAIPLEVVSDKLSDATITSYISSFTKDVAMDEDDDDDDYTMPITEDYLNSNCLPLEDTVKAKLDVIDSNHAAQKDYSDSPNSVISDLCRTYHKSRDFELLSKCDIVSEISPAIFAANVQTIDNDGPSIEDICDSSIDTLITEPCAENSRPVPFTGDLKKSLILKQKQSVQSEPDNSQTLSEESPFNSQTSESEVEKLPSVKVKSYSRPKKIFNTSKKPKAVYNHRHWQSMKGEEQEDGEKTPPEKPNNLSAEFDDDIENEVKPQISHVKEVAKESAEASNSVKVTKPEKKYYTVVRNVKQAYQCHESGETQEFNDDIEYLLEGLQVCNGIGTRCLSVLGLATKCMGPAFRIHLRAHGTMPRIFSALQDAPADANLSLCTATLLFVLSQDRLTMDIEASTLSLMLNLLEKDPELGSPEKELDLILEDPALCAMQEKHREKVYQLCEQMQQKGHAMHLKLDNINTSILAMETLLSLTSRKAGEWFKEEIRLIHGLDHIVDTISSCVEMLLPEESQFISQTSDCQMDKMGKIDRCLRVLENVTYMNSENQDYLLKYKSSLVIDNCLSLMKLCKSHLLQHRPCDSSLLSEDETYKKNAVPIMCLLSVMKVLLNITFDNSPGCSHVGSQSGFIENVLLCVLQVPRSMPVDQRFDLLVLALGLMINMVEHCSHNRKQVMELYVPGSFDTINDGYEIMASEALIEVMLSRLESARVSEEQADELLSSQEVKRATDRRNIENAISNAECLEDALVKTLQKAGKHMEHSIIAAYISLLLGCCIQNNQEYTAIVKDQVPDGKFDMMVEVLKKFMSFVNLSGAVGHTGVKSIQRILDVLSSS